MKIIRIIEIKKIIRVIEIMEIIRIIEIMELMRIMKISEISEIRGRIKIVEVIRSRTIINARLFFRFRQMLCAILRGCHLKNYVLTSVKENIYIIEFCMRRKESDTGKNSDSGINNERSRKKNEKLWTK